MKKIILSLIMAACVVKTFAQKGDSFLGAGLNFGTQIETVGIGVKYGYAVIDKLYIEPNFNIFLKSGESMWDINIDVNYRFYIGEGFRVYPIVGLSVAHYGVEWIAGTRLKTTKFGANFGAGISYDITGSWFVNLDIKYRAMSIIDQAVIGIGCGYRF